MYVYILGGLTLGRASYIHMRMYVYIYVSMYV